MTQLEIAKMFYSDWGADISYMVVLHGITADEYKQITGKDYAPAK